MNDVFELQNRMYHLEDCIKSCSDHPECNFFTMEKRDDHCLLYEDCEDSLPCETCASGGKYCSHGYGGEWKLLKSTRGYNSNNGESTTYIADNLDKVCGNAKGEIIHIYIQGLRGETYTFEVMPTNTVLCVKAKLRIMKGYIINDMILVFAGKELKDDTTLSFNNIRDKSYLFLILGGRRRPVVGPDFKNCVPPTTYTAYLFVHLLMGC